MALYQLGGKTPLVAEGTFVAPNATLIGSVSLAAGCSVWFGATLRGDIEMISIGTDSNVQDGVLMHTDPGFPLCVGASVTVGHHAVLHGCTIGDGSLVGIQAVVLSGAVIGRNCLVGAGSLVTQRKVFPDRSLILGAPAKLVRELTEEEVGGLLATSRDYQRRRSDYLMTLRPTTSRGDASSVGN